MIASLETDLERPVPMMASAPVPMMASAPVPMMASLTGANDGVFAGTDDRVTG